jgi:hypothetical protein
VLRSDPKARIVLTRGAEEIGSWPLLPAGRTGLELIDELARLQVEARGLGCSIRLLDAWTSLAELLELVGLADVLTGSALEPGGKAEGGEQIRVQEVVQTRDPTA